MESQSVSQPTASSPIAKPKSGSPAHSSPFATAGGRNVKPHFRPRLPAPFVIDKSTGKARTLENIIVAPAESENHVLSDEDESYSMYSYLDKSQLSAAVKLAKLDLERKQQAKQHGKRTGKLSTEKDDVYAVKESGATRPIARYAGSASTLAKPRTTTTQTESRLGTKPAPSRVRPAPKADRLAAQQLSELQDDLRFLLHQTAALNLDAEPKLHRASVSSSDAEKPRVARRTGKAANPLRYREFLDAGPDADTSFDNVRPFQINSEPQSDRTATGLRPRARKRSADSHASELRVEQVLFGYAPDAAVRVTRAGATETARSSGTGRGHTRTHTERVLLDLQALSTEADRLLKELGEVSEPLAAGNVTVRTVYERRLALLRSTALKVVRSTLDRFESAHHSSRCLASVYAELRKLFAKLGAACVLFRAPSQLRVEHVVRRESALSAEVATETNEPAEPVDVKNPPAAVATTQTTPIAASERAASGSASDSKAKPKSKAKAESDLKFTDAECARAASRAAARSRSPTESWLAHSGREFQCRSRTASDAALSPSPTRRHAPTSTPTRDGEASRKSHAAQTGRDAPRDAQVQATDTDRIAMQLRADAHRRERWVEDLPAKNSKQYDLSAFPLFDPLLDGPPTRSESLPQESNGRVSPFSVDLVVRRIDSLQAEQQRIRERWLQLAYTDLDDPVTRAQRAARANTSQTSNVIPRPPVNSSASAKPIYFHQPRYDDPLDEFLRERRAPAGRRVHRAPPALATTVAQHDYDAVSEYRARHGAYLRSAAGLDQRDAGRHSKTRANDPEATGALQQSVSLVDGVSEAILTDCVAEAVSEFDSAMHTIVQQLVAHELYEAPNAGANRRSVEGVSVESERA